MAKVLTEFDQVIGQTTITKWFVSCVQRDTLPQVTMLVGPAGIGKTSLALLAACEVACRNKPSALESCKNTVIGQRKSNDCVKVYNMSNLKSQDAVAEVRADLQVGLSSTGRKVIVMDEAHGMSEEAQDSLLTAFEALPLGVYIIVCSTNLNDFRDAFLSRVILRRLTNLNSADMRKFLKVHIKELGLRFEVGEDFAIALIMGYTGREPRRALNLLESFEDSSVITADDLDSFFNVYEGKQLVTLISYMYSGMILEGLDFISEFEMGTTTGWTLIELLKIARGGRSGILDRDSAMHLRDIVEENGIDKLVRFTIECTRSDRISRNRLSSIFLESCYEGIPREEKLPEKADESIVLGEDLSLMKNMLDKTKPVGIEGEGLAQSLEMLLADSEIIT